MVHIKAIGYKCRMKERLGKKRSDFCETIIRAETAGQVQQKLLSHFKLHVGVDKDLYWYKHSVYNVRNFFRKVVVKRRDNATRTVKSFKYYYCGDSEEDDPLSDGELFPKQGAPRRRGSSSSQNDKFQNRKDGRPHHGAMPDSQYRERRAEQEKHKNGQEPEKLKRLDEISPEKHRKIIMKLEHNIVKNIGNEAKEPGPMFIEEDMQQVYQSDSCYSKRPRTEEITVRAERQLHYKAYERTTSLLAEVVEKI